MYNLWKRIHFTFTCFIISVKTKTNPFFSDQIILHCLSLCLGGGLEFKMQLPEMSNNS